MRTERSVADVLQDLKNETRDFIRTRLEILIAEMHEKLAAFKVGAPMLAIGLVFLIGAFFSATVALIALIAGLLGSTGLAWAIGGACIFVLYLLVGGALGYLGFREIAEQGVVPEKTIRVLKQDQIWVQNETRAA